MNIRDLLKLLIKVFAVYQLFYAALYLLEGIAGAIGSDGYFLQFAIYFAAALLIVALYILIIKKSDKFIDLFQLDQGFESDQVKLGTINYNMIFSIAIIFAGGFLIADNISQLLIECFLFMQETARTNPKFEDYSASFSSTNLIISVINISVGFLLLKNHKLITKFLKPKDIEIVEKE